MSEHHDAPKAHESHALHEDHTKGPSNPKEINPKVSSDIAYWSKSSTSPGQLHEPSAPTAPTSTRSAPPSTHTKLRSAAVLVYSVEDWGRAKAPIGSGGLLNSISICSQ